MATFSQEATHECLCDHAFIMTAANLCYPAKIPDYIFFADVWGPDDLVDKNASEAFAGIEANNPDLFNNGIPESVDLNITALAIVRKVDNSTVHRSTNKNMLLQYTLIGKVENLTNSADIDALFAAWRVHGYIVQNGHTMQLSQYIEDLSLWYSKFSKFIFFSNQWLYRGLMDY